MIRNVMKAFGSPCATFVAGVGISLFIAGSALAQDPQEPVPAGPGATPVPVLAAAGEATTERVVVTGSYIPTAEEVTASPLDTLTAQEVARSGTSDVLTVLQKRNPDFVGGANIGSSNANISSGGTLGGSTVRIRGFPTLVLYQGRRIADSAAIAAGGFVFSDVAIFPSALLSRIDVLKDGASAQYGSDAIGGVVNIFTKDDFQGVEVGFRYGTTVDGAVAERRGYVISGVNNETTQVTASMQYLEMDPLFSRQRDYSAVVTGGTTTFGGFGRDSSPSAGGGSDGRYFLIGLDPLNNPGRAGAINSPFDVGVTPGSVAPPPPAGPNPGFYGQLADAVGPIAYRPVTFDDNVSFNLANVPTSTLDTTRTNVVASFNHQVFGKQLELFGNFLYSNSSTELFLNAQPLSNGTGVVIPVGRVGTNDDVTSPDYIPGVTNTIFNPFLFEINPSTLSGRNRLIAAQRYVDNPRVFSTDNNFYRFLIGGRSQITDDWTFETAAFYSKYDIAFVNRNLVLADQLNALIAGTGVDGAGNSIPALDFFAINPIGTNPGQLTPEQFNTIFGNNLRNLSSFQRVFDAKIFGFPFELPGGKVGFALGAEYRLEGFKVVTSPEIFIGSVPIQQINVKRDIKSVFAELTVPIVGSSMNVPGVHTLEIGVAGRFDRYEGIDEDAKVPKALLRYQPIKDLTLRATFSNSFVAPTLFETNGPSITGFSQGISIGGVQQDQAQVQSGSNPNLSPSKAQNYTAGLVYSPGFLPGLTISADYFRTLQQQIVGVFGGNLIIQSVNAQGLDSPFINLLAINGFPGTGDAQPITVLNDDPVGNPRAVGVLDGNLSAVFYLDTNQNLGAQRVEGFDLSARYNLDLRQVGQLELQIAAVVFTKYDAKTLPQGSPYYNLLGLIGTEFFGVIPDYKLNFLAEYRVAGFTLSLNANYIPEVLSAVGRDPETEDQSTFDLVDDYWLLDGRLSYTFKGRTTMSAVADAKDSKSMVDAKGGGGADTGVAGAAVMSPIQRLIDGTTLTVGCNNLLNEDPPFIAGGNSNTDLSSYDPYGQFVYFEISKKF